MDKETAIITTTIGAGIALGKEILVRAENFMAAALGHPKEDIGTIFGNYWFKRRENLVKITNQAGLILLGLDLEPEAGPQKVIEPMMEASSLEDDEAMQKIWANLLANATDPRHLTAVGPMFASMLRDLGSREVAFLEILYADARAQAESEYAFFSNVSNIVYVHDQLLDFYNALGIVLEEDAEQQNKRSFYIMLDILRKHEIIHEAYAGSQKGQPSIGGVTRFYHVTDLGDAFVAACRPPRKDD